MKECVFNRSGRGGGRAARAAAHAVLLAAFLAISRGPAIAAPDRLAVLSPVDEHLAVQIGFEKELMLIMKEETASPLHRLHGYDEEGYQIMAQGVVFSVPQSRTEQVLASLRPRVKRFGAMVFVVENNETIKTDKIGVIKTSDQYDILTLMHTNGAEQDLSHEDVVDQLKAWEKQYPFLIIGAENDWVEIEFLRLPKDVQTFAAEVYDFCPDAVDEDLGTVSELARDLKATKRLYLWWE